MAVLEGGVGPGGAGEIAKVSHTFQPSGLRLRVKLVIAFQIQVSLSLIADREDIADLRADSVDARFVTAEERGLTTVGGDLFVNIANCAEMELLGQEL